MPFVTSPTATDRVAAEK